MLADQLLDLDLFKCHGECDFSDRSKSILLREKKIKVEVNSVFT